MKYILAFIRRNSRLKKLKVCLRLKFEDGLLLKASTVVVKNVTAFPKKASKPDKEAIMSN
jgi:hypothetical protein